MLRNLVQESANNPGTGATVNLLGAPVGRQSFVAAFGSGALVYYRMTDGAQWEIGQGTVTAGSPNTLARTTVISNSAGNTSRLNFTGAVQVFNVLPAERAVYLAPDAVAGRAQLGKWWAEIQQQTVSGVSAVDFTLPAGFRRFRLEIDRGRVATAGQALILRCGTGGSFDAGASDYTVSVLTHLQASPVSASPTGSGIPISGGLAASDLRSSITVTIDPGTVAAPFQARTDAGVVENTVPSMRVYTSFGSRNLTAVRDAIRVLADGGATISGTFTLEGYP